MIFIYDEVKEGHSYRQFLHNLKLPDEQEETEIEEKKKVEEVKEVVTALFSSTPESLVEEPSGECHNLEHLLSEFLNEQKIIKQFRKMMKFPAVLFDDKKFL